jgi:N utilization substance protein A
MMKVVEDVFKTLLRKKYGSDENFDVIVNAEKGDLEIIRPAYDRGRWAG